LTSIDVQLVRAGVVALESRITLLAGPAVVASVAAVLATSVVVVEERPDGAALVVAAPRVAPAVAVSWRLVNARIDRSSSDDVLTPQMKT
jgi:hypothetical protein